VQRLALKPEPCAAHVTKDMIEGGFPHSEIRGSKVVRTSPRLIAAYHVLHRLSMPRHPLNALKALDRFHRRCPFRGTETTGRFKDQLAHPVRAWGGHAPSTWEAIPTHPPLAGRPARRRPDKTGFTMTNSRRNEPEGPSSEDKNLSSEQNPIASHQGNGGAGRDRTDDILLAKQALSQLSYGPISGVRDEWWAWEDLNLRPHAYQARALTN
jgi:hypothetical protein